MQEEAVKQGTRPARVIEQNDKQKVKGSMIYKS